MKSLTKVLVPLALMSFSLEASAVEQKSAADIVGQIQKNLAPENFKASYVFTNYRTDSVISKYEVRFQTRDVDHSHGYFEKPEREKGREILRLSDNLWTYLPSVGRMVRIADRESFAGGDFSNADVLRVDWLKKYNPEIIKDLPNQWIVELKAKAPDAAYAKMRLWVDKKNGQPVQQLFYDSQGILLKKCLYGSVKSFGKIERPAKLRMENVITKQASELEILDLTLVPTLPDSRFAVDNMGK